MPVFTSTTHWWSCQEWYNSYVSWRFPHMADINNALFKLQISEWVFTHLIGRERLWWLWLLTHKVCQCTRSSLVCTSWFRRGTSGSGSAVHHARLWLHNSRLWDWVLTGRRTDSEPGASVSVGSLPSGSQWKRSVCMFGFSACEHMCQRSCDVGACPRCWLRLQFPNVKVLIDPH